MFHVDCFYVGPEPFSPERPRAQQRAHLVEGARRRQHLAEDGGVAAQAVWAALDREKMAIGSVPLVDREQDVV